MAAGVEFYRGSHVVRRHLTHACLSLVPMAAALPTQRKTTSDACTGLVRRDKGRCGGLVLVLGGLLAYPTQDKHKAPSNPPRSPLSLRQTQGIEGYGTLGK